MKFPTKNEIPNAGPEDCNSKFFGFMLVVIDCLKNNESFQITNLFDSHQYKPGNIFEMVEIWTGEGVIDLKQWENQIWSKVFNYALGPCYTSDISKVEKFKFLQYQVGTGPFIEFTFAKNVPWHFCTLTVLRIWQTYSTGSSFTR